jgi:hypothetical protein
LISPTAAWYLLSLRSFELPNTFEAMALNPSMETSFGGTPAAVGVFAPFVAERRRRGRKSRWATSSRPGNREQTEAIPWLPLPSPDNIGPVANQWRSGLARLAGCGHIAAAIAFQRDDPEIGGNHSNQCPR